MSVFFRRKWALLGSLLVAGSASAAIDLSGPTTDWLPVLQGEQFDLKDTTPNNTLDFVGNSAHPLLYLQYDDNGTLVDTSDDEVAFRIRVGGDSGGTTLDGEHYILVDMTGDDVIDGAIGVRDDGKTSGGDQPAALFYVTETGGSAPSNTVLLHNDTAATTAQLVMGAGFTFLPVSISIDPVVTDVDLFNDGGTDYFVSFKFPWSYIEDSVAYYTSQGNLPPASTVAPETALKLALSSSKNHNNFVGGASDIAGYVENAGRNISFAGQNALSPTVTFSTDADHDGVDDLSDNCMWVANTNQLDTDSDGLGDVCDTDDDNDGDLDGADNCPLIINPDQLDYPDADGIGNECDPDDDNDGDLDGADNCPLVANPDQVDADADGYGDLCDNDYDGDGANNDVDNCPFIPNPAQQDTDGDGLGNVCDDDDDNDGVDDYLDACPIGTSPLVSDNDGDGCDDASEDADDDNDGILDGADNCPLNVNADQLDTDGDGLGDVCDTDDDNDGVQDDVDACPIGTSPLVSDNDGDGCDDASEDLDDDNDQWLDVIDNCPLVANTDQLDTDGDLQGDACDTDDDGDGVPDSTDNCPLLASTSQIDSDRDGQGNVCDTDDDGKIKTATRGAGSVDLLFVLLLGCSLIFRGRRV